MVRRTFMTLISGGLLAAPLAAGAQPAGKVYNIGYLGLGSSIAGPSRTAFYQGLQEHGWIEGQNFVLTTRFAQFKSERLRELVAELVQRKVDVIVVSTAEGALAAKHGTSTIPIVAVDPADAVAIGLVATSGESVAQASRDLPFHTFRLVVEGSLSRELPGSPDATAESTAGSRQNPRRHESSRTSRQSHAVTSLLAKSSQ